MDVSSLMSSYLRPPPTFNTERFERPEPLSDMPSLDLPGFPEEEDPIWSQNDMFDTNDVPQPFHFPEFPPQPLRLTALDQSHGRPFPHDSTLDPPSWTAQQQGPMYMHVCAPLGGASLQQGQSSHSLASSASSLNRDPAGYGSTDALAFPFQDPACWSGAAVLPARNNLQRRLAAAQATGRGEPFGRAASAPPTPLEAPIDPALPWVNHQTIGNPVSPVVKPVASLNSQGLAETCLGTPSHNSMAAPRSRPRAISCVTATMMSVMLNEGSPQATKQAFVPLHRGASAIPEQQDLTDPSGRMLSHAATITWFDFNRPLQLTPHRLESNYEPSEGKSLPRSVLFSHYLDYCAESAITPVNAAGFGKLVRQQFPHIRTRRLGTRGQSKYHYFGIGVKFSSPYRTALEAVTNYEPFSDGLLDSPFSMDPSSGCFSSPSADIELDANSGTRHQVHEFPIPAIDALLPESLAYDQVNRFIQLYRNHCDKTMDLINSDIDALPLHMSRFWKGAQGSFGVMLGSDFIADLVATCDDILYRSILAECIPDFLATLSTTTLRTLRALSKRIEAWVAASCEALPEKLGRGRKAAVQRFAQLLRRRTTLNHLAQTVHEIVSNPQSRSAMLGDLGRINLTGALERVAGVCGSSSCTVELFQSILALMQSGAALSKYVECVDVFLNRQWTRASADKACDPSRLTVEWSFLGSSIMSQLMLRNYQLVPPLISVGNLNVLLLFLDESIMHHNESTKQLSVTNSLRMRVARAIASPQSQQVLSVFRSRDDMRPSRLTRRSMGADASAAEPMQALGHSHTAEGTAGTAGSTRANPYLQSAYFAAMDAIMAPPVETQLPQLDFALPMFGKNWLPDCAVADPLSPELPAVLPAEARGQYVEQQS